MELFHWLREPIGAVVSALGGWLAIDWVTSRLATLMTIGSIIKSVWRWIRGRRQDSDKSQQTTQNLSGGIDNINSPLTDSQQVAGHHNVVAGENSQVHIGGTTHDNRRFRNVFQYIFQGGRMRPASQQPPGSSKRRVTALDESPPDTRFSTAVVPVPTPGEAQSKVDSESVSLESTPSTDGSGNPSIEMTATTPEAMTEAELIGRETPGIGDDQTDIDKPLGSINDEGANIAVDIPKDDSAEDNPAISGFTTPLDKGSLSNADAVIGVDQTPASETVDILDDASDHSRTAETTESAIDQAYLADQPTIENVQPDNPQDESDTVSRDAASIAEAIPVVQLSVRTDEPESHPSGERESSVGASSPLSAQQAEAKALNIDRDIAAIAGEWSTAVIGATLQRLRRARGLSRTDLSYDPGWVMAFEAGCWHTYETDRRCFVRAIHTYLQTLGMTTAELRACLLQQDTDE